MSPIELPMAPSTPPAELPPASERERAAPANGRRFRVEGMDCAACAKTIEKTVAALDGVAAAQVSFGAGTLVATATRPMA